MDAAISMPDPGASQGAHRATGDAPGSAVPLKRSGADMEVVAHARCRKFSTADKRRILAAADRCTESGQIGALLRREGVYSSSLSTWRCQREVIDLAALAPQKRRPKADPNRAETQQIANLTLENGRLQNRLKKALLVIEVQKKLPHCWATRWTTTAREPDGGRARTHPEPWRRRCLPGLGPVAWRIWSASRATAPRELCRTVGPTRCAASPAIGLGAVREPRAAGRPQQRAIRRRRTCGGLRHAARRRALSRFGANDVPPVACIPASERLPDQARAVPA